MSNDEIKLKARRLGKTYSFANELLRDTPLFKLAQELYELGPSEIVKRQKELQDRMDKHDKVKARKRTIKRTRRSGDR